MKLILGVLLMISLVGCDEVGIELAEVCSYPLIQRVSVRLFDKVESGHSCDEFNLRQVSLIDYDLGCATPLGTPTPVNDSATQDVVNTNNIISGIDSGDVSAVTEDFIVVLNNLNLDYFDRETLALSSSVGVKSGSDKIISYGEKIIISGYDWIQVLDESRDVIFSKQYEGAIKVSLKANNLHLYYKTYPRRLSDETLCQRINYVDTVRYEGLSFFSKLNLDSLSIEKEQIFYGGAFNHLDLADEYIVYNHFYEGVSAIIPVEDTQHIGILNGTIKSSLMMQEYGSNIHVFSHDWSSGTNYNVLGSSMDKLSFIEGIAPGEEGKTARFTENHSYLMTYFTSDPLFVFDVTNNELPILKGELKFPSEPIYMRDINENLLVSIGYSENFVPELSLFNVSDPLRPLRVSQLELPAAEVYRGFSYKNLIVSEDYILLKTYNKAYLVSRDMDDLKLVKEIDFLNEPRFLFKGNDLYMLDSAEWEKIEIND